MNTRPLIAVALAVAAATGGQAFAQTTPDLYGQEIGAPTPFVPGKTRADVQAELAQYRQAGVNPWSTSYNQLASFKSTADRADVTAAYLADRNEASAFTGEDSGSAYLAAQGGARVPASSNFAGQADQSNLR